MKKERERNKKNCLRKKGRIVKERKKNLKKEFGRRLFLVKSEITNQL